MPPEEIKILFPQEVYYATNNSLQLNYTVRDYGSGIDSVWFSVVNSTGYQVSNTTLTNGQNATFNVSDEDLFTLYLYANDTSNNINFSSVTFGVSTSKPSVILNYPTSTSGLLFNSWLNYNNVYFNFTATQKLGLSTCYLYGNWTGTWAINYTWLNPNNATMNFTQVNINDGYYKWNVWCNNTINTNNFALLNNTFHIDTIFPTIDNMGIRTTQGSQTINFTYNIAELNPSSCFYSVYDFNSGIADTLNNNLTIDCAGKSKQTAISSYGTYNLIVYARDLAGNEISNTTKFTISQTPPPGGGGGGGPIFVESNKTICGDGICQPLGNSVGLKEDFWNCFNDCAQNATTFTILCNPWSEDATIRETCWWSKSKPLLYLFIAISALFALSLVFEISKPQGRYQIKVRPANWIKRRKRR